MIRLYRAVVVVQLAAGATGAIANAQSRDVEQLVAQARAATELYSDRSAAITNGYRRVGPDFPSMGEHWLSPKLILEGKFDVSRPQLITYVTINGRPVLSGVVYAIPLARGELPPRTFGPDALWHEHNGSVDEEGLLPEHHTTASGGEGTRVAFLHVWTRIPAPNGIFSAENWAIPFLRLQLPVPSHFPDGAARALSLLSGGADFFGRLTGPVYSRFNEYAPEVEKIVALVRSNNRALDPAELDQLDSIWARVLSDVNDKVGPDSARRINGNVARGESAQQAHHN